MARLSYERSPFQGDGIRQICIAVSQDGNYTMVSSTNGTNGPVQLEGKMSEEQFQQLKRSLAAHAFRSLSGNHGGLIRDHAGRFVAEISRIEMPAAFQFQPTVPWSPPRSQPAPPRRLQWLNADDESPFPKPMAKGVEWMKNFEPRNAKALDSAEISDACPTVGLRLIEPSIAAHEHP